MVWLGLNLNYNDEQHGNIKDKHKNKMFIIKWSMKSKKINTMDYNFYVNQKLKRYINGLIREFKF